MPLPLPLPFAPAHALDAAYHLLPSSPHADCVGCDGIFQLSDLDGIVSQVAENCPNLRYLSLLKNPCCPNFLEEQAGKDLHDYQLYRFGPPTFSFMIPVITSCD